MTNSVLCMGGNPEGGGGGLTIWGCVKRPPPPHDLEDGGHNIKHPPPPHEFGVVWLFIQMRPLFSCELSGAVSFFIFFACQERLVMYDGYPYSVSGKLTKHFLGLKENAGVPPPPPPPP